MIELAVGAGTSTPDTLWPTHRRLPKKELTRLSPAAWVQGVAQAVPDKVDGEDG